MFSTFYGNLGKGFILPFRLGAQRHDLIFGFVILWEFEKESPPFALVPWGSFKKPDLSSIFVLLSWFKETQVLFFVPRAQLKKRLFLSMRSALLVLTKYLFTPVSQSEKRTLSRVPVTHFHAYL